MTREEFEEFDLKLSRVEAWAWLILGYVYWVIAVSKLGNDLYFMGICGTLLLALSANKFKYIRDKK